VETAAFEEPSRCFDDDRPAGRRTIMQDLLASEISDFGHEIALPVAIVGQRTEEGSP
jgi:hypothetical protein